MTPAPDWLTKAETAKLLGVSLSTVERMIQSKQIEAGYRPMPHRRAAAVCNPTDVNRLLGERQRATGFRMGGKMGGNLGGREEIAPDLPAAALVKMPDAFEALMRYMVLQEHNNTRKISPSQKAYLTLDEAVEYSGLPKAELLRMIGSGLVDARKCGRWYIRRKSLDAL